MVEFIPGEAGYSPHWNVNVVHTAEGVTLADILASPWASAHYPEALFDDVEDILAAQADGLVTLERPGVVVLCPIISEEGAEAPGNHELPEDFPPFPSTSRSRSTNAWPASPRTTDTSRGPSSSGSISRVRTAGAFSIASTRGSRRSGLPPIVGWGCGR